MSEEHLIIYSCIKKDLKNQVLMRGMACALLGALIFVMAGAFMPPKLLSQWGFPLFLLAMTLITIGLLPYRLLNRLESQPYKIIIEGNNLRFISKNKIKFTIPIKSIAELSYIEKKENYGIGIDLKKPVAKKITVEPGFDLAGLIHRSKRHEVDIFLPYFSKNAFAEIKEHLWPENSN